jgi:hypothetical protein
MPTDTDGKAPAQPDHRERRAHVRHSPADLPTIRSSRLKHGPSVSLIDLSVGGALIEADVQLKPGTRLALEIASGSEAPSLVPMRVLRCEVATIRPEVTIYRGACEFVRPLEWPMLMSAPVVTVQAPALPDAAPPPPQRPFVGIDASLKILAERSRAGAAGGTLKTADVLKVLDTLRIRASQLDPDQLAGPMAQLLPTVASALERRDPAEVALAEIEARLRAALPRFDIRLTDSALPGSAGAESIIFRPEQATDLACVLNVQVPTGTALTDWQFRLLKASMHLCSLLDAAGLRPTASTPRTTTSSWQKLVVRYKDGRLVKGFSHDFNPTRAQFAIWPSVNAPEHEGILVPISVLKAVFFVRDFRGDSSYVEDRSFDAATHGRRVEVTFADNEVVNGTTLSYRPDGQGFFLNPADPRANNIRIFVVTSAVRHVRFLGTTSDQSTERPLQLVAG